MADEYDDTYTPEDEGAQQENHNIRQLREKARRAEELEARLAQMEREAAFAKALGPAMTDPRTQYFVKGYDGDIDPDAIRAAAARDGFLSTEQPPRTPPPADLSAYDRLTNAATGGSMPAPQGWQQELMDADRIQDQQERENAILAVVEKYGGATSRTAQ